jgi:hypothetical protein
MRTTIEMAREAAGDDWGLFQEYMPEIHRLAELVRADERERIYFQNSSDFVKAAIADEREACAKVCDDGYDTFFANNGVEHNRRRYDQQAVERAIRFGVEFVTADCAAAIRARGNT